MPNKQKTESKGQSRLVTALVIILFIAGVGILCYPLVSNMLVIHGQSTAILNYTETVNELEAQKIAEMFDKAVKYNNALRGEPVNDPFIPGSGMELPRDYAETLNVNGIMAYLEVPSIDLSIPIMHGTSEDVIQRAAGHIPQTALPVGGKGGNSVITSHTGLPSAKLFTDLVNVELADLIYIEVLDRELVYEVVEIKVITPDEVSAIGSYRDRDLVTLLTCTPYGINSHRLLVIGERRENLENLEESDDVKKPSVSEPKEQEETRIWDSIWVRAYLSIGSVVAIIIFGVVLIIWSDKNPRRKRRKRKKKRAVKHEEKDKYKKA